MDAKALANCTCFNLRKAARAVTQVYDETLKPSGLKATQLALLAMVERRGPTAMTELAQALVMDRTTLTRNLKPLAEGRLIAVEPDEDRRFRKIRLTARGQRVLAKARPLWEQAQIRLVNGLGRKRWSGFLGDLSATVDLTRYR